MLATLSGDLCLFAGLALLLLPLLAVQLSRPRDGVWGAVILLLGLVLVTSSDRLRGAPMLAVLCSTLLIGRLVVEVSQSRWSALSSDEQASLSSNEHWATTLQQLLTTIFKLSSVVSDVVQQLKPAKPIPAVTKKWVRPEIPPANSETITTPPDPCPVPTTEEPED